MLKSLKDCSEAKKGERTEVNNQGEPVPLQSIPPPVSTPEGDLLQPQPSCCFPGRTRQSVTCMTQETMNKVSQRLRAQWEMEAHRGLRFPILLEDMHIEEDRPEEVKVGDDDLGGDVNPSVKDTSGAPVKFVRDKVASPVKEDDDIVIVSSTASRRRTMSSAAALKKKKAVLGVVISEPGSSGKGDRFVIDDVEESGEEGDVWRLKERSTGKLRVNDSGNRINNRRIAKDVDEVPTDGVDFYGEEHEARWKFVRARKISIRDNLQQPDLY
ncbi:hypothetical protein LIER_19293 [Lithospermum erythrorhizon]|uniref:Uncharacterized protein n=1 Tax=Lithospermum erythrorhizon TaxID=34254 RepID=A0AAV3QI69_LITER